jgi:DNA-binding LacI/PurR family transcriptional regulator
MMRKTSLSQEKTREVREPALPLHRRIAQSIQQDIIQQNLKAHTKIPSELDLAKQYGVSHGTITKALESLVRNGIVYRLRPQGTFVAESSASYPASNQDGQGQDLSQDELVRQKMQEKPPLVGIIVPHLGSDFLDGIVLGAEMMTRSFGYGLSFAYSEDDWALERYHIEQFLRQGVAGIILYPGEHAVEERDGHFVSVPRGHGEQERIELLRKVQQYNMPFVLIDRYVPEVECNYVVSDDFNAGYASTQHLIKTGHRRIGFVTIAYSLTSSAGRYAGYKACLNNYGLPDDERLALRTLGSANPPADIAQALVESFYIEDRARIAAYLQGPERPDAVVAMNDFVALQIMRTAEEIQMIVPDDLAVVCAGGSNIGAFLSVPLTCITQPVNEIGRQSAYILLNIIARRFSGIRQMTLPVSLVSRKSSGAETSRVPEVLPQSNR